MNSLPPRFFLRASIHWQGAKPLARHDEYARFHAQMVTQASMKGHAGIKKTPSLRPAEATSGVSLSNTPVEPDRIYASIDGGAA
jgi:hypothetical protein